VSAEAPTRDIERCYLCGGDLIGQLDEDHVPPKQIFAHALRQTHDLNLRTFRVHRSCNAAYQRDEDYFVSSLAPLAIGSYAGFSVVQDQRYRAAAGERLGLLETVRREFDRTPSGIVLPPGKIVKRFQGTRIGRVTWKILRGLYFQQQRSVLPEDTPHRIEFCDPSCDPLPTHFAALEGCPTLGPYPSVFDYRYARFEEVSGLYLWALLLWDRLLFLVGHHDPDQPPAAEPDAT